MRAGAIRGPRYSGRERTKSGILNVSRIEQVQNASIARAGRPQHARAALEPLERRLPPRGGHWGLGSHRPVRRGLSQSSAGERTPGPAAAAAAGDAALAAGRADRERARQELLKSSKLREQSLFKFFKPVPRDEAAAAASSRQAEQRAQRDEQRAKEVEAAAKEQEQRQVANVQARAVHKHDQTMGGRLVVVRWWLLGHAA